jgi:hypothetical protein
LPSRSLLLPSPSPASDYLDNIGVGVYPGLELPPIGGVSLRVVMLACAARIDSKALELAFPLPRYAGHRKRTRQHQGLDLSVDPRPTKAKRVASRPVTVLPVDKDRDSAGLRLLVSLHQ